MKQHLILIAGVTAVLSMVAVDAASAQGRPQGQGPARPPLAERPNLPPGGPGAGVRDGSRIRDGAGLPGGRERPVLREGRPPIGAGRPETRPERPAGGARPGGRPPR
jgi:hypothetical protein